MGGMRELGVIGLLLVGVGLAGCDGGEPQEERAPEPRAVKVLSISTEVFTRQAELPGRVEPVRVAEVRARVPGIVLHKPFEEGADVKAGDLLFQIDPAPLKAAVSRAEAELARADATLFEAQALVRRYEPLVKIEAVSQQEFDSASAALRSGQAARRAAQADLETARLNLGYASVKAPISGRIGRALVTEGALVGEGEASLMARIQQLDPVYVDFTQPVADALRLREALAEGGQASADQQALSIRIEGTEHVRQGTLLFTDVAVDRGTGQLTLRGRFDNDDGLLLPGMYVRVQAPQGTDPEAIFVPQRAIQRNADGSAQVLVIGTDSLAEVRPVRTGVMQGARWQVLEGLAVGDEVIVGGANGLAPGDPVRLQQPDSEEQPAERR